ncbi:hypothetical protein LSH36_25g10000 [Paralvinella palmiformis]|uniref:Ribosomal protein eL8/eL30/eS12/Gadd45 domain-containing protein n=1 Tax=Paralvinella palmiformis TaxID=53620 RepID=A0AAD9KBP2_9ANNE|nr:hypothetical protein LSH36_25g10000 [Paralvinella palmiformis]
MHRAHSSSNVSRTSTTENDLTLHFDDEDEFPNLLSAAGGLPSSTNSQSSGPISYSDILKNQTSLSQESSISGIERFRYGGGSETQSTSSSTGKESKNARKRRKRRELASRAADEELAEICLEQTVLKELRSKSHLTDITKQEEPVSKGSNDTAPPIPKPQSAGKKSKQPISLNFADMISALEKQQEDSKSKKEKHPVISQPVNKGSHIPVVNPLDTSAPVKRGKEREVPKVKKPSPLKKVILKEREEKKRLRLLEDANPLSPSTESSGSSQLVSVAGLPLECDLSQDAIGSKTSGVDFVGTPVSAEMSPISQTSPISMSPLSGSPLSSGVNSPIASNTVIGNTQKSSVLMKIHSRRFREYCNQVLDKNIDECCTQLLQDLVRFQDRLYHRDPTKAKARRRIVLGLREVTKHLKLNRIKCVIISPNMERIQSKGGLDEALNNILDLCTNQDVPFVFALGRRALGRACAKLVPVSVAGIFNYEGSEENFKKLMALSEKARNAYKEMVALLEQEMEQQPLAASNPGSAPGTSNFSHLFAHLGHSRTPSACSAISFTSSILSEPISENYPHSEPETDSRGYEIVANNLDGKNQHQEQIPSKQVRQLDEESTTSDSLQSSQEKVIIVESLDDVGHEADNEADDDEIISNPRKRPSVSCTSTAEKDDGLGDVSDVDSAHDGSVANSVIEKDLVQELPHIDSIHSIAVDISAEILSQHSSKTLDLNAEVLSTHSSKTLEAERCGHTTPERMMKSHGSAADLHEANPVGSGTTSRLRPVDNQERVQSWVADSQKHLNMIGQCSDILDDHITNNNTNSDSSAKFSSIKESSGIDDDELGEVDNSCNTCISMQSVIAGVDKLAVSMVKNPECGTDSPSCNNTDPPVT